MVSTEHQLQGAREHLAQVARGSAVTLAGAVTSTVATFGLVIVVTRNVEPETAGRFFAMTSVFLMALAAASLGTDTGLARFVLRTNGPGDVLRLIRMAALPVVAAATGLAVLVALLVPDARALAWALPFAAGADLCLAAMRARASFRSTVLIDRIARPGLQVLLVGTVLVADLPGGAIALAWSSAYVVSALLSARSLRRGLAGGPATTPTTVRGGVDTAAFWRFTWPRAVARVAQVTVQKLDIVLVAYLLGATEAAAYTVATRFVVFGQLANQAISSVVQPRFTLILTEDPQDPQDRRTLNHVFGTTTCWSILLAWPVYACVAAAPSSYLGLFGQAYVTDATTVVVLVMVLGMLLAVASGPVDTLLLMAGRSSLSLLNTLIALAVDVALCLLLLPALGIVGAAIAWAAAVVLRAVLASVQLGHDLRLRPDLRAIALAGALPVVCVALPVGVVTGASGSGTAAWLGASSAAGLCYAGIGWRLRSRLGIDVATTALGRRRGAVSVP